MMKQALEWTACGVAVLIAAAISSRLAPAWAGDREAFPPLRAHGEMPAVAAASGGIYMLRFFGSRISAVAVHIVTPR